MEKIIRIFFSVGSFGFVQRAENIRQEEGRKEHESI